MKKKKTYKTKAKPAVVNEPSATYGEKRITFFNSFEEMAEADVIETAKFTPIERLQHITEFIMHAYSDELKNKMTDLKINYK